MVDRIYRINENFQVGGIIRLDIIFYDYFSVVGIFYSQGFYIVFYEWDRGYKDLEKCIILGNLIQIVIMGIYFEKCYVRFMVLIVIN